MDFRPILLILLIFVSLGAGQSYFSGAFAKKIANVSTLIKTIVENGDREASNANLFLSQIIMKATDIPMDAEGSGEKVEKKTFIPLTEVRKYATEYLESVARQTETSELKMQLGEALRELRMENVRRKVSMDKFIEKFNGNSAAVKYNEFEDKMIEVEKNVIKFFTMKSTPSFSDDIQEDNENIMKELNELLGEKGIFDLILSNNRYTDDVFVKLFQHFRNHAIFLTVSSTITEVQQNKVLLNNSELFDEYVKNMTENYKSFLTTAIEANTKRESDGFSFENSFTASEVESITESSVLPVAKNHNLFHFNWDKEEFKEKYMFLTVRRCGDLAHDESSLIPGKVDKSHGSCITTLYRSDLTFTPLSGSNSSRILREKAAARLLEDSTYQSVLAHNLVVDMIPQWDLIAIYTVCDRSTVSDTVYTNDQIYKVAITLEAKYEYQLHPHYFSREWKIGVVQIIAYFMKPMDATY